MIRATPFVLVLALIAVFSSAHADTLYVDDDNCPGPGDGSELNPYCSIQDGINAAGDGHEIVVAPGTYAETIDFLGKAITVRSSGGLDVTTIDGTGSYHVVQCVSGEGPDTVLDGFTITGGNADGSAPDNGGGGMLNDGSSPTVIDCEFIGNTADFGGGMHNSGDSSPTISRCAFRDNEALTSGGGMLNAGSSPTMTDCEFIENTAAYGGGMYNFTSSPTLIDCAFIGNMGQNGAGGMRNVASSSPMLTSCTFIGNTTQADGGGMWNGSAPSSPMVADCTFTGNSAGGWGGGMYNRQGSTPFVVGCLFDGNSSSFNGGGMSNNINTSALIFNCSFIDNVAGHTGGGLHLREYAAPLVVSCLFADNSAGDHSGGGVRSGMWSNPSFVNCTFSGNVAPFGGAIAAGSDTAGDVGHTLVASCVLWNNTAPLGPEIALMGAFPAELTVTYSDVRGGEPGVYVLPGFTLNWGPGNIGADPLFADPDNGDYRLGPGSPCIDAGDNAAVPPDSEDLDDDGDLLEPIPYDLDGNPRFVDDPDSPDCWQAPGTCGDPPVVDMGAYEFQGSPCPWDLDDSGAVGTGDLLALLAVWGSDPGGPPDFDGDGNVGTSDLLKLLANWGPCP